MPGFNAGTVVSPLDYTFEPHVKKSGTIREPNDKQIAAYMSGIKALMKSYQDKIPATARADIESASMEDMMAMVEDLDPDTIISFHDDLAGVYAALCSGDPSKATLLRLPIRIRTIFYAWLQQEVMSPEVVPGAGSSVTTLRAAAG